MQSRSRKTDILRAAAKLFLAKGYNHTSVAQVAAEVGMLKGSLYYHIRSKDDLLCEVILDALRKTETNLLAGRSLPESGLGIQRRLRTHLEYLSRNQVGLALLLREAEQLPRASRDLIRAGVERHEDRLAQTLRLGQCCGAVSAGDPAAMAQLLVGACTWTGWIDRQPEWQALAVKSILRLFLLQDEAGRTSRNADPTAFPAAGSIEQDASVA